MAKWHCAVCGARDDSDDHAFAAHLTEHFTVRAEPPASTVPDGYDPDAGF